MSKHIHIHLPQGMSLGRKTKDAGFDESKHKRDHGKFASTAGPGTETHHTQLSPGQALSRSQAAKLRAGIK